jgi:putative glutamine amidotransferase
MAAPIIGITTQRAATAGSIPVVGSPESYIQAVQNAGGLPLLIPLDLTTPELDEVFSHLDGGICRGIQVINVALGGTLYTHIHDQHPNALRHDWYPDIPRDYLAHPVQVAENSSLTKILGKSNVATNSLHHQGIHQPAPRLIPVAWAPDGIIEAVELTGHPFGLGVQWHPENLQAYPEMRALFQALVSAARLP